METTNKRIEIARSFSRKVNLGNYETADFFASFKCELDLVKLPEEKDARKHSKYLFELAKSEVENSIKDLKLKNVERNLEAKLKIETDALRVALKNKKGREVLDLRFKISLIKDEIKDCKII